MSDIDKLRITDEELLDFASKEELFLFADKGDFLNIAHGVLELVQLKLNHAQLSQSIPEWIPVSDRLPEIGVYVIAMESDGRFYKLRLRDKSTHFWDRQYYYYTEVTHWMPLPSAPNLNKE